MMQPWENGKNPNFGPNLPPPPWMVLSILVVRQSPYAISRKTNKPNLKKWQKNLIIGPDFGPFGPNLCQIIFFVGFTFISN